MEDYDYDELNRLEKLTVNNASNMPLFEQTYTLAADGQRTAVIEKRFDGVSADPFSKVRITWTYDALDRLIAETRDADSTPSDNNDNFGGSTPDSGDYAETFAYDLAGNRLEKRHGWDANGDGILADNETALRLLYSYNGRDQLIREGPDADKDGIIDPATATLYGYDTNGSMTSKGADSYTWDLRGRMVSAMVGGVTTIYGYDAAGQRISEKSGAGAATYYLNDKQSPSGYPQVLEETSGSSPGTATLLRSYVQGLSVLGQAETGNVYWFLRDGHGSTRALLGSAGVVERYDYDAFGGAVEFMRGTTSITPAQAMTVQLFGGDGEYDKASGFSYHDARWRDRFFFTSYDSFEADPSSPASLHKYLYASANPVYYLDSSGNVTMQEGRDIHAAIEAMYGTDPAHQGNVWSPELPILTTGGLLRPDITDFSLGEVAEIKPLSPYGLATGPAQLAIYLAALNGGTPFRWRGRTYQLVPPTPHLAGAKPWTPSSWAVGVQQVFVPTMPTTWVLTVGNAGGVIYYTTFDPVKYTLVAAMAVAKQLASQIDAMKTLLRDPDGAVAAAARRQIEFSLQFSISQHTLTNLAIHAVAATAFGLLAMVGIATLNSLLAPGTA